MLRAIVGFEGSCPQSDEGVRQEGENTFRIFPSWRPSPGIGEESVGRSTRLGFRVANDGQVAETVTLLIDWQYDDAPDEDRPGFASREEFMSYRDFVVVRGPGDDGWRTVMGDVEASVVSFVLRLQPGETEIHWHPPYTYTQTQDLVAELRHHPLVEAERIGSSEEGRDLWLLHITDESSRPKTPVLIQARAHAYESAGSYAMEGMVRWLLSEEAYAVAARREYLFNVISMANPDGVFNGLGRLTAPQGADVIWTSTVPDRAHAAIKQTVECVRPRVYIDLHNWQNKHVDGLLGLDPEIRERFLKFMPDQRIFGKHWFIREPSPLPDTPPERETMGAYCRRVFGAVACAFELPWFGRTPDDVRTTGRKALWALLRAMDEPPDGVSWR